MTLAYTQFGGFTVGYKISDLIDIDEFKELMEQFYNITNVSYGLVDAKGEVISGIGWQKICTKFHRGNIESRRLCIESDTSINVDLPSNKDFDVYVCKNGLMEAYVPIVIEGNHVGTLFFGQFFLDKPDKEFFANQADKYGFNKEEYLIELDKVPIISMEDLNSYMKYFSQLAKILSKQGLCKIQLQESERLLRNTNAELEKKVIERTVTLERINKILQKDIRERVVIEDKLKKSEASYKKLIELLPYGVALYKDEKIIFMNAIGSEYFGYSDAEDVIGMMLHELFTPHEDYRELYETNVKNMDITGIRSLTEEKFIRQKDGELMYLETISSFVENNGCKEILVVFKDISEKKKIQEMYERAEKKKKRLQEKNEYAKLRTEFFANLSHELRTPVNIIYSAIQLFEREISMYGGDDEKINKRLKIMKQNCNRIIRLVNNLIDITKIDSGYLKLEKKILNLVSIVEDITMSVADYIENKNIRLIFDTDSEEKIAMVDPNAIERIMLNLLSNAVKFTNPDDEIFVSLHDEGDNIIISVKDSGIGIPSDKLEWIFDRFRQVDKSLNRNHEGSGIGLSLVKSLVDMHHGEISAKSGLDKGSEFIISIPKLDVRYECEESQDESMKYCSNKYIEKINIEFSDIYS